MRRRCPGAESACVPLKQVRTLREGGSPGQNLKKRGRLSVETDEVGFAFFGVYAFRDFGGALPVVGLGTDAHPVASGSGELDDVRGLVLASEMLLELLRLVLLREGSYLYAPAATLFDGVGRIVDLNLYLCGAGTPDAHRLGRADGEVDDAIWNEGSAVSNAHDGGLAGLDVGHADQRAHG